MRNSSSRNETKKDRRKAGEGGKNKNIVIASISSLSLSLCLSFILQGVVVVERGDCTVQPPRTSIDVVVGRVRKEVLSIHTPRKSNQGITPRQMERR